MKISKLYPVLLFLVLAVLIGIPPASSGALLLAATSPGGVPLGRFDLGARGPSRVAVDSLGRFYVTDPEGRRIFLTDARGQVIRSVDVNAYPLGIAVASDGRIFIGDADRHGVFAFDSSGRYLFALGSGEGEFERPSDVTLQEALGRIYVADSEANQIKVYDLGGSPLFNITDTGSGPLNFPTGVAVDPTTGNILVSDHNNARLQVFDGLGVWLRSIGNLTSPGGLCIDDHGLIYVSEAFQGRVLAFAPDGTPRDHVGEYGERPGELRTPTDTLIDPFGRLAVVSHNNRVLELYGPPGFIDPPLIVSPPQPLKLSFPGPGPVVATGTLRFEPRIRPASSPIGPWIEAAVELSDDTAGEIYAPSVLLNDQFPVVRSGDALADLDQDGLGERIFLFDREAVLSNLTSSAQPTRSLRTTTATISWYAMVLKGRVRDATFEVHGSLVVRIPRTDTTVGKRELEP